jgi:hypothetical protein
MIGEIMEYKISIEEVLKEIEIVTESFYQQKNNIGYQKLVSLIDTLAGVADMIAELEQRALLHEKIGRFTTSLNDAVEALLNKDTILLADILRYDISDILKEVQNSVKE